MKALILCAGMGTRLGDLTTGVPKPMLPLNGKPLLAYTLEYLVKYGIKDIAINLHFLSEQITQYFKEGSDYGVKIHYSYEAELLGTAGALTNLTSWLGDDSEILVLYGDILTSHDLSSLIDSHYSKNSFATLLLHKREKSNSIVEIDETGQIICFLERPSQKELTDWLKKNKPCWVNSGVQIVSRTALDYIIASKAFDLPRDVYCRQFDKERIFGVPLSGFRIAIDSVQRYEQAQQAVMCGDYKI